MNQKDSIPLVSKIPKPNITLVKVELKDGGTLDLMDDNAVKLWFTNYMAETMDSKYNCVHVILDKQLNNAKAVKMYRGYLSGKVRTKADTIMNLATLISKAYDNNH